MAEHVAAHTALRAASELAQSAPGIRQTAAAAIIAETGPDMKQFPGAVKLATWLVRHVSHDKSNALAAAAPRDQSRHRRE
jgi:transposase